MSDQEIRVYEIGPIPGYGLGFTATAHISRGDLIISEAPLITIDSSSVDGIGGIESLIVKSLKSLPKDDQNAYLSLHNCYGAKLSPFLGILKTNSIQLGVHEADAGIFLQISRINHSCVPNAAYSWNRKTSEELVHALTDISPGEQITVSYLDNTTSKASRSERQLKLRTSFDFECFCEACARSPNELDASDRRRRSIAQMDSIIGMGSLMRSSPGKTLRFCQRILEMWEEEGLRDVSVYRTYYDAFQVCVMHGDLARAGGFAALALKVKEDCEGKDAVGSEEIEELLESPESHPLAGTTSKWKTRKNSRRSVDSEGFEEWLWGRVVC